MSLIKCFEGDLQIDVSITSKLSDLYIKLQMGQAEFVDKIIEEARRDRASELCMRGYGLTNLPESIGDLATLTKLDLRDNHLTKLPESIGNLTRLTELDLMSNNLKNLPESICKLTNLANLYLGGNEFTYLPEEFGNLSNLVKLHLWNNQLEVIPDSVCNLDRLCYLGLSNNKLTILPDSLGNMTSLSDLDLSNNHLVNLPDSLGNLINLEDLNLRDNQINTLPKSIENLAELIMLDLSFNELTQLPVSMSELTNLQWLNLNDNPFTDLSTFNNIHLGCVDFLYVSLPRRYWTNLSDWKAEWLLNENNAETRRILIEQLGYEKICEELSAIRLDTWREYILLKIDDVQAVYEEYNRKPIGREPMVLLKMTCPSTQHIHILRVPPEMTSAEDAITWVNHGIHPDKFAVQT